MNDWTYINIWKGQTEPLVFMDREEVLADAKGFIEDPRAYTTLVDTPAFKVFSNIRLDSLHIYIHASLST